MTYSNRQQGLAVFETKLNQDRVSADFHSHAISYFWHIKISHSRVIILIPNPKGIPVFRAQLYYWPTHKQLLPVLAQH